MPSFSLFDDIPKGPTFIPHTQDSDEEVIPCTPPPYDSTITRKPTAPTTTKIASPIKRGKRYIPSEEEDIIPSTPAEEILELEEQMKRKNKRESGSRNNNQRISNGYKPTDQTDEDNNKKRSSPKKGMLLVVVLILSLLLL